MICPKCHTPNDDEEKFCKNCGFQLSSSRICPECGVTNDSNSKYCKECGTVLTPVNTFRKKIIEENTKESFFSMYKIPIICGLVIILAVGAAAGMAFFSGNSGGDDDFSIIPLENNSKFVEDTPVQAEVQENTTNKTNQTNNQTNDTNKSKTITEKVNNTNKTKNVDQTVNKTKSIKSSKNNSSKTLTEKVDNKLSPINDKVNNLTNTVNSDNKSDNKSTDKSVDKSVDKSDAGKSITEKTDKASKGTSDNGSKSIIPGIFDSDDDLNDSDDSDSDVNDSDESDVTGSDDSDSDVNDSDDSALNDSDDSDADDLNDTDDVLNDSDDDSDDSLSEIEMSDVPGLASKVSGTGYSFSTIEYDGHELTRAQCIYIFSEYISNIQKGQSSSISISDFGEASNPSGEDLSQSIEKSDYTSIAGRVHSWMNSEGSVPNYVGITESGASDLSPSKMLKLFTEVILESSGGSLPESVEI